MTWKEFREYAAKNQAVKQANEDIAAKIRRTAELLGKYKTAKTASEQAKRSTPCLRAMRCYMRAVKNASDPRTPLERVKELLDAKIASDPILKIRSIIGKRDARKEASIKVTEQPAKKTEITTALKNPPDTEKPLEGVKTPDPVDNGKKTVTFSDGRTVDFPAKNTTPVKSASENPMLKSIKEALARRRAAK